MIKSKYDQLLEAVVNMEADVVKVEESQTRAAGKRVRKGLQEVKVLAQELRLEIMDEIRKD